MPPLTQNCSVFDVKSAFTMMPPDRTRGGQMCHICRPCRRVLRCALQDLVVSDAPCMTALLDVGVLRWGDKDLAPTSAPALTCISRLTHLRTLSLERVGGVLRAPEGICLPRGLTALLLHGDYPHHLDGGGQWRDAAEFGRALLRMPGLQCLDVEVEVLRRGGILAQPAVVEAVRRRLWAGLRPALQELPLHLGARVVCK